MWGNLGHNKGEAATKSLSIGPSAMHQLLLPLLLVSDQDGANI